MPDAHKLPQVRLYLKSAKWGFDELVAKRLTGYPFVFYMVGILATLRAVRHVLKNRDRNISPAHQKVIDNWWKDPKLKAAPELAFITNSRNLILKEGAFASWATRTESGIGEGSNYTVKREDYDLAYYVDGERHDLMAELRSAIAWCECELARIEAALPG